MRGVSTANARDGFNRLCRAHHPLECCGVEYVMKSRRTKASGTRSSSAQLDLFSLRALPTSGQDARVDSGPPLPVSPASARTTDSSPAIDPLVAFVLGSPARGRPEKALPVATPDQSSERRLLDVREAAIRLGLSKSTLDKMRCSGRGPKFIRATDRAIRYDPADLAAFADERRRRSTSELAGLLAS